MKILRQIHRLSSCTSTNDVAKDMAERGAAEGTVVLSDEQTSGRGRYKREWFSPKGQGLYVSVVFRPEKPEISLLTLAAGLAVADALYRGEGVDVCLKWPNDLLWNGRKLGGILCESSFTGQRLSYVVSGIGINANHREEDFPPALRQEAVSLKQVTGKDFDRETFLPYLWKALEVWYDLVENERNDLIISAYLEHSCYVPGQKLVAITDRGPELGTFMGLNPNGGVLLETRAGVNAYFTTDIKSLQEAKEK